MNRLSSVKEIKVSLDFGQSAIPVGRLALRDHIIYFAYEASFIEQGMDISPFILPLKPGLTSFDNSLFEGLPGLFNDSLPDGWGRLLFDRLAQSQGGLSSEVSPLDRLAYVGKTGMGALVYEPEVIINRENGAINLDSIAQQALEVLKGSSEEVLQELLTLNGSSAGARPKALIGVSVNRKKIIHGNYKLANGYDPWLVKFPNSLDGLDAGAIEYVYALMAKEAGIEMPPVHLFPAFQGPGYFAAKRFDRDKDKRVHMHSACGLLHADFRLPSLDYENLIGLTLQLTRDMREVEKMFRLAVFNVLTYNRDDHSKNFSFLMDECGQWKLSPAYDLTFSSGPGGEQSTMVMGEGKNPGVEHLIKLGEEAKLSKSHIKVIIEQTQASVANWPTLARHYGVTKAKTNVIAQRLGVHR